MKSTLLHHFDVYGLEWSSWGPNEERLDVLRANGLVAKRTSSNGGGSSYLVTTAGYKLLDRCGLIGDVDAQE